MRAYSCRRKIARLKSPTTTRFEGELFEEGALRNAVEEGIKSSAYTSLLVSLSSDLKSSLSLQESMVTPPQGLDDLESFQLELRGLVMELKCPHLSITGNVGLLDTPQQRLQLLEYLLSEAMAARLVAQQQEKEMEEEEEAKAMEVNGHEVCSGRGREGEGRSFFFLFSFRVIVFQRTWQPF